MLKFAPLSADLPFAVEFQTVPLALSKKIVEAIIKHNTSGYRL
jgi:hypothetical protein